MKDYLLNLSDEAWSDQLRTKRRLDRRRKKESRHAPAVTTALLFRLAIDEFFKLPDEDILALIRKAQSTELEDELLS